MKKIYYAGLVCLVAWVILIYSFSAQPVTQSVGLSRQVGQRISEIFVPGFKELKPEAQNAFVERIDFGIRKTAHFLEYMVLGIWWFLLFLPTKWKNWVKVTAGIAASAVCAAGDEIHQLSVAGRTGRWQDVCIDTAGAAAGILILGAIVSLLRRRRQKKQNSHKNTKYACN